MGRGRYAVSPRYRVDVGEPVTYPVLQRTANPDGPGATVRAVSPPAARAVDPRASCHAGCDRVGRPGVCGRAPSKPLGTSNKRDDRNHPQPEPAQVRRCAGQPDHGAIGAKRRWSPVRPGNRRESRGSRLDGRAEPPALPSIVLRPGQSYRRLTEFRVLDKQGAFEGFGAGLR